MEHAVPPTNASKSLPLAQIVLVNRPMDNRQRAEIQRILSEVSSSASRIQRQCAEAKNLVEQNSLHTKEGRMALIERSNRTQEGRTLLLNTIETLKAQQAAAAESKRLAATHGAMRSSSRSHRTRSWV